jgi:hypothetical protein
MRRLRKDVSHNVGQMTRSGWLRAGSEGAEGRSSVRSGRQVR